MGDVLNSLTNEENKEPDAHRDRGAESDQATRCSAKGCRAAATWALTWNNPKIHAPTRRKTWLACNTHQEHLTTFLKARNFLKDVTPFTPTAVPDKAQDATDG